MKKLAWGCFGFLGLSGSVAWVEYEDDDGDLHRLECEENPGDMLFIEHYAPDWRDDAVQGDA